MMLESVVQTVTNSYLGTALWSSTDYDDVEDPEEGRPFDDNYSVSDFTDEASDAAYDDCERFLELLQDAELTDDPDYDNLYEAADDLQGDERIGHDFWLTRNGHGAGFWDGDYADYGDLICEVLYAEFSRYSEVNLFADGEGSVGFEG